MATIKKTETLTKNPAEAVDVPILSDENSGFVHLHVHSHYSLLESCIKIPKLVERVTSWKNSGAEQSVALTDHGNMFGALDFYLAAKAKGVKPILGCEVYYTDSSITTQPEKKTSRRASMLSGDDSADDPFRLYNLVLLVKNKEGYRNLCEIVSRGYLEGFLHSKPRVDRSVLEKFSEGLICLTGGLKGEMAYSFVKQKPERAEACALWLQKTYREDLYFELQENGLPEQHQANRSLVDLADRMGLGLAATTEAHYLKPKDLIAQEALMCISSGRTLGDVTTDQVETLVYNQFYLKTPAQMKAQFAWRPEACSNTVEISKKCSFDFHLKDEKGRQIYHLPKYQPNQWADKESKQPLHEGNALTELAEEAVDSSGVFQVETYLKSLSKKFLEKRFAEPVFLKMQKQEDWPQKKQEYEARLHEELAMIERTGFAGYFLIVADFILYAKSVGIPVGPGRGSGAGSLVAYALKITDIDPLAFNLLFERFINPERISMPDFDVDFCQDKRGEVIDYVVRKYGKDCVSQIITYGKLLARSVVRDVGRVLDIPYAEVDAIAKLIPEELGIDLAGAFEKEPRLTELCERDDRARRLFEIARSLEGLHRNAGMHAAGVVITNRPLVEYAPLMAGKEGEAIVQYDKDYAEKIGLIKFDFLGLKTLTVIDNALKLIREGPKPDFRLEDIDYTDPKVYELLSSGDTDGVFQLESSGMKDLCQRVMPSNLEDITSINALYRPGPLESGMVDDFINRKHGRTTIEYALPQLEPILNETYGVIVYQEQVMRVARELAGYSLGEADLLRRAMGKKKAEEMASQKERFLKGCVENQLDRDKADFIFELLAKFASYGFNKSHSAAYGVLSYQTAYLKCFYPAQFLAALMATEMDNTDKMAVYISDARARGLEVLPPDVNASLKRFSVNIEGGKSNIRFGLEAIKGVGGVAVDVILAEREARGAFRSFLDFCKRVALRKVNKKVLECLIQVGAFDRIAEENRATLLESVDSIMKHAAELQEHSDLGQVSMFDEFQANPLTLDASSSNLYRVVPDWPESKKLQVEKSLVGFYVSGHPMEKISPIICDFIHGDLAKLKVDFEERKKTFKPKPKQLDEFGRPVWNRQDRDYGKVEYVTAGIVASFREITTKKGSKMAFCEIEDNKTKIEGVLFPEPYEQFGAALSQSLKESKPIIVTGQIDLQEENAKILIRSLDQIEDFKTKRIQSVILRLDPARIRKAQLTSLRSLLQKYKGRCLAVLEYEGMVNETHFYSRHSLPKELMVDPSSELLREVNALFGGQVMKFL